MRLTTKGRYAVMAVVDMAACGTNQPLSMPEIALRQNISLTYLEQIFGKLRRAKILKSVRGPKGGYMLAKPSEEILVSDVVLAVDEKLQITRCRDAHQGCMPGHAKCLTHDLWDGLGHQIFSFLSSVTIEDVCKKNIPDRQEGGVKAPSHLQSDLRTVSKSNIEKALL